MEIESEEVNWCSVQLHNSKSVLEKAALDDECCGCGFITERCKINKKQGDRKRNKIFSQQEKSFQYTEAL